MLGISGKLGLGVRAVAILCGFALATPVAANALYPKKGDASPHRGVRDAHRKVIQGIDVSRWQADIDWAKVRSAGTRFAFIKATEGGDHLDPMFRRNWEGAKRAGVPRSAYHFVWWCRPARDQVRWMKRHIPRDADALPPVLDVEWNGHSKTCGNKIPRERALSMIREMLRGLEEHTGKKPIIYTDITFHEDVLEGELNEYPFWIRSTAAPALARYNRDRWEFWQFTTTGRVPGIVGDVDRNAFYGSERDFVAWKQGRYDIGTRRMIPSDSRVAQRATPVPRRPPAIPIGARPVPVPATTGTLGAPARLIPPRRIAQTER